MDKLREKLAAILSDYFHIGDSYHYTLGRSKEAFGMGTMSLDDFTEYGEETIAELVDHLLANGVTVQRRIPTTERIPTRADADPDHEKVMAYSISHKAWKIEHFTWVASHPDWFSHWMPMPKPPKEVQK